MVVGAASSASECANSLVHELHHLVAHICEGSNVDLSSEEACYLAGGLAQLIHNDAAPLLCAGITVYSPLRTWNVGPGSRVGVIGIGGLGHLAVRLAEALGATVTVITRSAAKAQEAHELGAKHVLLSTSAEDMQRAGSSFDVIIDTIPTRHDLSAYVPLLDIEGALVIVGNLGNMEGFSTLPLILGRRRITGSPSGGIAQTQEMLNFCAQKGVYPECEIIPIQQINQAFERMERGEVKYRFVIDMASLSA